MKLNLQNVEGQELAIDLDSVDIITMSGQRNSNAGWVRVDLVFKSGHQVTHKLSVNDYDSLLSAWNPQEPTP